jgi:hypothetical protein
LLIHLRLRLLPGACCLQARKLKEIIGKVRENYERDWDSKELPKRQVGA